MRKLKLQKINFLVEDSKKTLTLYKNKMFRDFFRIILKYLMYTFVDKVCQKNIHHLNYVRKFKKY
ncbi:hypothetical protein CKW00_04525 [Salimicrobium humidisoli]|uniref:Uncharacterized protein n=1 Tax=Salimicrobium humidisoli TaxID=2029857 RepID=A0ABX4HTR5_9BACI|nr:hypothetical protein CKW00_04525 [Salimicrobium humidisoli]